MRFEYIDSQQTKYVFDFVKEIVEITVYFANSTRSSSTARRVRNHSIHWLRPDDCSHISDEAMRYCDKLAKNLAFA